MNMATLKRITNNKIEKGSDILPETFSYLRSIFYYFGGILYIPVPNIESITIITLILYLMKKRNKSSRHSFSISTKMRVTYIISSVLLFSQALLLIATKGHK